METFVDTLRTHDTLRTDASAWGALADGILDDVAAAAAGAPLFETLEGPDAYESESCGVEPLREPCTDAIPYDDLVFWLGSDATGHLDCGCGTCAVAPPAPTVHGHFVYIPSSRSRSLSAKIPVISLPRIEGVF